MSHFNRQPFSGPEGQGSPHRSELSKSGKQSMISGADVYPSSLLHTSVISNHYEVPNLSSMLYEYTNTEMDRIRYSFRVGNFYSLRDLPRHLLPGNVT